MGDSEQVLNGPSDVRSSSPTGEQLCDIVFYVRDWSEHDYKRYNFSLLEFQFKMEENQP